MFLYICCCQLMVFCWGGVIWLDRHRHSIRRNLRCYVYCTAANIMHGKMAVIQGFGGEIKTKDEFNNTPNPSPDSETCCCEWGYPDTGLMGNGKRTAVGFLWMRTWCVVTPGWPFSVSTARGRKAGRMWAGGDCLIGVPTKANTPKTGAGWECLSAEDVRINM